MEELDRLLSENSEEEEKQNSYGLLHLCSFYASPAERNCGVKRDLPVMHFCHFRESAGKFFRISYN